MAKDLAEKPEIVALSKCDAMTEEQIEAQIKTLKKAAKKTPLVLSAQSKQGVPEALRALLHVIDKARAARRSGGAGEGRGLAAVTCMTLPAPVRTDGERLVKPGGAQSRSFALHVPVPGQNGSRPRGASLDASDRIRDTRFEQASMSTKKNTPALTDFRRIVVKVGSSLLVDAAGRRGCAPNGSRRSARTSPGCIRTSATFWWCRRARSRSAARC